MAPGVLFCTSLYLGSNQLEFSLEDVKEGLAQKLTMEEINLFMTRSSLDSAIYSLLSRMMPKLLTLQAHITDSWKYAAKRPISLGYSNRNSLKAKEDNIKAEDDSTVVVSNTDK